MKIKDMYGFIEIVDGAIQFNIPDDTNEHDEQRIGHDDFCVYVQFFNSNSNYIKALNAAKKIKNIIENNGKFWLVDAPISENNTFMCIDVETANQARSSICQIGIAVFENGVLIDKWQSLINPQQSFNDINIKIHGITEQAVKDAPTLRDLSDFLVNQYFQKYPATCYGNFDKHAFNDACPEILDINWLDITQMVRRTWSNFSQKGYNLSNMASHLGIAMTRHHDALSDAITGGHILLNALSSNGLSVADWQRGKLPEQNQYLDSKALTKPNSDGHLAGKSIVFTGELSMPRSSLEQLAMQNGLDVKSSVSSKTHYLVNGVQTARNIKDGISSKLKKAIEIKEKGGIIQIITEQDFFDLLTPELLDN